MKRRIESLAAALVLGMLLTGCGGENPNEKLADSITRAVQANDMTPVERSFNALVRPKLTHAAIGRLADELAPLGKLKRTRETTPSGAPAGRHSFTAAFEKGTASEDLELDEDGKVAGWHVHDITVSS